MENLGEPVDFVMEQQKIEIPPSESSPETSLSETEEGRLDNTSELLGMEGDIDEPTGSESTESETTSSESSESDSNEPVVEIDDVIVNLTVEEPRIDTTTTDEVKVKEPIAEQTSEEVMEPLNIIPTETKEPAVDQDSKDLVEDELNDLKIPDNVSEASSTASELYARVEKLPILGNFLNNAYHAFEYIKNYHPKVTAAVGFVEEKGQLAYTKLEETKIGKEVLVPKTLEYTNATVNFIESALTNSTEINNRDTNAGAVKLVKMIIYALWMESRKEVEKTEIFKAGAEKIESYKGQVDDYKGQVGEKVEGYKQQMENYKGQVEEKVEGYKQQIGDYKTQATEKYETYKGQATDKYEVYKTHAEEYKQQVIDYAGKWKPTPQEAT